MYVFELAFKRANTLYMLLLLSSSSVSYIQLLTQDSWLTCSPKTNETNFIISLYIICTIKQDVANDI